MPQLAPGGSYFLWLHLCQVACGAAAAALATATLVRLGAHGAELAVAVGAIAVAPLALGALSVNAFDLWLALIVAGAVAALASNRLTLAAALLGLGAAAKAYPLALVPLLLIAAWRRSRRGAVAAGAAFAGAALAVLIPFAVLGPHGLAYTVRLQASRGLQMESLGASPLETAGHLGLSTTRVVIGKPYSLDLTGGAAQAVGVCSTVVVVGLLLLVYRGYRRRGNDPQALVAACAAAVAVAVAFDKVLSPQFLLWLVPLVPLLEHRRRVVASLLLLVALALTHVWFPSRFWHLAHGSGVSWVVLARNVVLVALALYAAAPLLRSRTTSAA